MKINADVGESGKGRVVGNDREVMRCIDWANIACGFHASDPMVMRETVRMAVEHGVRIGAHPGYDDAENFGRVAVEMSAEELCATVVYQVGALQAVAVLEGGRVEYVKPHGAMYHQMMQDEVSYEAIMKAVKVCGDDKVTLDLMVQWCEGERRERYEVLAERYGVRLIYEAFGDRGYAADGSLLGRGEVGAMVETDKDIVEQIERLDREGVVKLVGGGELRLEADSVCVHGDHEASVCALAMLRSK